MLSLTVPSDLVPTTLELRHYLRRHAGISLAHWRRIKASGTVYINGHQAHPCDSVTCGDIITIHMPLSTTLAPSPQPISICYEDEWLLIVDKPAGLLTHPTGGERTDTLANRILYHYAITGQELDYHPVHRLDRQTSGTVLIAKFPHVQHLLDRDIFCLHRRYLAIIHGSPNPSAGSIQYPIARAPGSIITRVVDPAGQPAVTDYQTLAATQDHALVTVELHTGRTHQIRVHFSHLGHPLLGDSLYGSPSNAIARQALHAHSLSFIHPITGDRISAIAEPPNDFYAALQACDLAYPISFS